ncbi:hypothetical protein GT755_29035 [Herbidospora sp. NEAU-GS84]|uniref:Hemerythrin-like domain-containing protein n=1 Tax=Herbidospora solisilvae TaxID=2696284 RepID=A0A7C9NRL6_9ACTN|nr:hypothetical protein [Herbidospora solisilvae]NAS25716.1 hypothetical protein [Herbidospora solisilvae]
MVRRDLGRLLTAAGQVRRGDARCIAALHEHHTRLLYGLHQHACEDELLWPRLRDRALEASETLAAVEAGHRACNRWIQESADAFRSFGLAPSAPGRQRQTTALWSLADMVERARCRPSRPSSVIARPSMWKDSR